MNAAPRIVLLTGNGLRHRYVANVLAASVRLCGVLTEGKANLVAAPDALSAEDREIIARHLGERDAVERELFGAIATLPDVPVLTVPHDQSNTAEVAQWVNMQRPDFLVLYGTSIIKEPLLSDYDGRVVNLHLGLSPYYRGTATNFWPLVERQPECVGATLHIATLKVDAGPILAQVRPAAEASDRAHQLGCKTIIAAAAALPRVLAALSRSDFRPPVVSSQPGKLFRRRDFNAAAVESMWKNFATGMMDEYIMQLTERQARFPIVELSALEQATARQVRA